MVLYSAMLHKLVPLALFMTTISNAYEGPKPKASKITLEQVHEIATRITVKVSAGDSSGSGVWISDQGYVATCYHVVRMSPSAVKVGIGMSWIDYEHRNVLADSFFWMNATLVAHDDISDVAILKVDSNPFQSRLPT